MDTCAFCTNPPTARCARCTANLCPDHKTMGQPLITIGNLVTTTFHTATRTPALLGDVLLKELPLVAYCSVCDAEVVEQRQAEQLKFLGTLLLGMLVIGLCIIMIAI